GARTAASTTWTGPTSAASSRWPMPCWPRASSDAPSRPPAGGDRRATGRHAPGPGAHARWRTPATASASRSNAGSGCAGRVATYAAPAGAHATLRMCLVRPPHTRLLQRCVRHRAYPVAARARLRALEQPGIGGAVAGLEGQDGVLLLQGQADVVQAVEQAVPAEGVHLEAVLHAVRTGDRLRFQVHGQGVALAGLALAEQLVHHIGRQHHRQQAVLEAVVVEDVGKARRDDRAEAVLLQRPRRVLARGA